MAQKLRWAVGLFFILGGIGNAATVSVTGGILGILIGLLILPPTFALIAQMTGQSFGKPIKYGVVLLLFAACLGVMSKAREGEEQTKSLQVAKEKAQAEDKKKQEQLAYERLPKATKDSIARAKAREEKLVKEQEAQLAATEAKKGRAEKVAAQFSSYDGSHRGIERYLKEHMNDPDSYEHVSTRYIDKGDFIAVMTQFRGKNAFNATILKSAVGKVDLEGNVLSLEML